MAVQSTWDINPRDFIKNVNIAVKDAAIDVASAVFEGVVDRSPVYTGNFRASWRLSHTSEDSSVSDGGSPGSPLPAPKTPKLSGVPDFPILFVTNYKPYSVRLEYGWSKQAPSGMIRTTLDSLRT